MVNCSTPVVGGVQKIKINKQINKNTSNGKIKI